MLQLPVEYVDIYMDDYCNLVQGTPKRRRTVKWILLHAIDEVLRPLDREDTVHQEPISVKKLQKGDGDWSTQKTILGWLLDTTKKTIQLPPHRHDRLRQIFKELRGRKRCSEKK